MSLFRKHDRRLRFAPIFFTLLLLLLADAAYAGLRFRSTFKSSACNLKRATDRIERFDIAQAGAHLERALDQAETSASLLRHPSVSLGSFLPWIGDDVKALRALTEVAEQSSLAGLSGLEAAESMGISGSNSLSALYDDGRVQFEAVERGRGAVAEASEYLRRADEALEGSPRPNLGPVRSAFFGAGRIVDEAVDSLSDGESILASVPSLLGGRGVRRYFLAFQTPSEARGGGGLIGVYGILEARDGELSLEKVAPIRDLVPLLKDPVTAPEWFEDLYRNLDALAGWREANQSPTFPTTAEVLLKMYEASVGERLDGMIAMDPLVLAALTEATGPIKARGYPDPVGPDNAGTILMRNIYLDFEQREDEQNAFLKDLVDRLYRKLGSGDIDGSALTKALAESIRTQHLKMYARSPIDQDALSQLGIAGDPESYGPNVQMVFHNNFAANKIDWYLQRGQDITIKINDDGSADVVTIASVSNGAPPGQKSLLKKSDVNELPAGLNVMSLHFMLPEGSKVKEFYLDNTPSTYFDGKEAGIYPVAYKPLQLRVQDAATVSVAYKVPDLVEFVGDNGNFFLTFVPQALVRPDDFNLRIIPPEGFRIGLDEPGARFSDEAFVQEGKLTGVKRLPLRVVGPDVAIPEGSSLGAACG